MILTRSTLVLILARYESSRVSRAVGTHEASAIDGGTRGVSGARAWPSSSAGTQAALVGMRVWWMEGSPNWTAGSRATPGWGDLLAAS